MPRIEYFFSLYWIDIRCYPREFTVLNADIRQFYPIALRPDNPRVLDNQIEEGSLGQGKPREGKR
jgi:hypothetical protein